VAPARATKPAKSEYLAYYGRYVDLVPDGDILETLTRQMKETQGLLTGLPASVGAHRYAPGKWSVNETVGHLSDAERIFTARALRFARGDSQALPGFEQDDYVQNTAFDDYPLAELAAGLASVRQSTLYLFRHLGEDAWTRKGIASGAEVTVRALAFITAGHELHHQNILRTKYLGD
jgi:hypothetical protein